MDAAVSIPKPVEPAPAHTPDLLADVHFAKALAEEDRERLKSEMLCVLNADTVPEVTIAVCVLFIIFGIPVLFATPLWALIGLLAFMFIAASGWSAYARLRMRRHPDHDALAGFSDPTARVRLVGQPEHLHGARGILLDADAKGGTGACEPEIFRITHISGPRRERRLRAGICFLAAAATLAMVVILGGRPLFVQLLRNFLTTILLVLAIMRAVWAFVWPTTVRAVPGRVDVLQHSFMGAGRPRVSSYNLRTARMLIDFDRGRTLLRHDETDNGRWLYGVVGRPVAGGREMGLAVLAAAYSEFEPPVGPNDSIE